jgi:hypothetical protein
MLFVIKKNCDFFIDFCRSDLLAGNSMDYNLFKKHHARRKPQRVWKAQVCIIDLLFL